jgi:acyl carrier protein
LGVFDDFFEMGGHSLLAMRVISRIRSRLSLSISVHAIFQFRCINELAKFIEFEMSNQPLPQIEDLVGTTVLDV